ncbi:hypothetical protein RchiOBHm_Chr7g0221621 [Rosa chinensis]|uniref:Uncharacterized protein n=1 Tax=Rosa chinensis TaxID=74649 RepID=A0A2P6PD30_ROSCH|nr:hypothetical protein RchiOBHm_Chr7g0221621 [Rosa chinensis]
MSTCSVSSSTNLGGLMCGQRYDLIVCSSCFALVFWDDSSSSGSDLAFNFVYEVMVWIGHSNCVHFAFKRMIRIMADGLDDAKRMML